MRARCASEAERWGQVCQEADFALARKQTNTNVNTRCFIIYSLAFDWWSRVRVSVSVSSWRLSTTTKTTTKISKKCAHETNSFDCRKLTTGDSERATNCRLNILAESSVIILTIIILKKTLWYYFCRSISQADRLVFIVLVDCNFPAPKLTPVPPDERPVGCNSTETDWDLL